VRTLDDCLHAMRSLSGTTSYVALERKVAEDVIAHLEAYKNQTPPVAVWNGKLVLHNEVYINGVRYDPGEYDLMRKSSQTEPAF
jgi:hypothetical protein